MTDGTHGPITDIDIVDIVGVRKDGGLDMVISVTGPIDDSQPTLSRLEDKIRNYIKGGSIGSLSEALRPLSWSASDNLYIVLPPGR